MSNVKRETPLVRHIARVLKGISETPALDAQVLLAHITQKPRAWVLAHPELTLSPQQQKKLDAALKQLQQNIPLPYVLGQWSFFGMDFIVSRDVLIPRPETEELVEMALDWLDDKEDARILDMGTGSGCIPIAIARNARDLSLLGVDRSPAALKIARQNAAKYENRQDAKSAERELGSPRKSWQIGSSTLEFAQSDLFENLPPASCSLPPAPYNLLLANLPYIPTETLKTLDVYTREPSLALDGGADGLDLIRRFLADAPRFLAPKGLILLEIDSSHGQKALHIAEKFFSEATSSLLQDLSGRDRFIRIQT